MDMNARINELLMNEEFQKRSVEVTTKEGVQALFTEFGVNLTEEEVDAFLIQLGAMLSGASDELGEEDLDNVAGGGFLSIALSGAAATAFGVACGITIGVGALAVGGYYIYKTLRK